MEWVWSFLFGLCLIYAIANTNNNKQNSSLIQICLSSIPFWDVPKYCHVSKNKINNLLMFLLYSTLFSKLFEKKNPKME